MNVDELHEEMEGSKRDIQAACDSVHVLYYRTPQPWMHQPTQAAFIIHITHPTHPSSTTPTTTTTAVPPPAVFYAAAVMPHGYQRIHRVVSGGDGAVIGESTAFKYDEDVVHYPTLNGLMMRHSGQYKTNKENELATKLQALAASHGQREEEEEEEEEEAEWCHSRASRGRDDS